MTFGPLTITKPSGDGWQMVKRNEQIMVFQRVDPIAKNNSTAYVAPLTFGAVAGDRSGIEAELKQSVALALPRELAVQGVTYKGSQSRERSCVTAQAEATRTVPVPVPVPVPAGEPASATMTLVIMACRLTGPGAMGYMLGWSHAASERYPQTAQDAEAFFKGVTYAPPSATTKVVEVVPMYLGSGKGVLRANSCPKPAYPPASLAAGRAGTGRIRVDLSVRAQVLSSEVIVSSGTPELDEAARAVLPRCNYLPSLKDSQPVPDSLIIEYVWTLSPTPSVAFDSK